METPAQDTPTENKLNTPQFNILQEFIIPTINRFPEILWLASAGVNYTQEGISEPGTNSWAAWLVDAGVDIELKEHKYVEFERTVQSLVCLYLLNKGDYGAYFAWTQGQEHLLKLTWEAFQEKHAALRNTANSNEKFDIILGNLIYSDLGKTEKLRNQAIELGINKGDHDDLLAAIFVDINTVRKLFPSFTNLTEETQKEIVSIQQNLKIHWGHLSHLEGGSNMLKELIAKRQNITLDQIYYAFFVQICDVAGSKGHVSLQGALPYDNPTDNKYCTVLKLILRMLQAKDQPDPDEFLQQLYKLYAKNIGFAVSGINHFRPAKALQREFLLTRFAAFLRLTHITNLGVKLMSISHEMLEDEDWHLLIDIFGVNSGVNTWLRNPTYMPTVLINLYNNSHYIDLDTDEQLDFKLRYALSGMLVMANICQSYAIQGHTNDEQPLCFNKIAGFAKDNPDEFIKQNFKSQNINWHNIQNPILVKEISTTLPQLIILDPKVKADEPEKETIELDQGIKLSMS